MTSRFKAMIFDMDGTLLDSMLVWRTVWREYIEKKGLKMPEELVGKSHYGWHQILRPACRAGGPRAG